MESVIPSKSSSDRRKSVPHKLTNICDERRESKENEDFELGIRGHKTCNQAIEYPRTEPGAPQDFTDGPSPGNRSTKRRLFSRRQLTGLKDSFQRNAYPSREEYDALAGTLGMKESSVKQWFQNARAKLRKRGSLSSATKTFYLDRTEPLSRPSPRRETECESLLIKESRPETVKLTRVQPTKPVTPIVIQPTSPVINSARSPNSHGLKVKLGPIPEQFKVKAEPKSPQEEMASPGKSLHSSRSSSPSSPETFQTMTQVSLPADHPFCNLHVAQSSPGARMKRKSSSAGTSRSSEPGKRYKSTDESGTDEDACSVSPSTEMPGAPNTPYYMAAAQYMHAVQAQLSQLSAAQVSPTISNSRNASDSLSTGSTSTESSAEQPLDLSKKRETEEVGETTRTPIRSASTSVQATIAPITATVPPFLPPGGGLYPSHPMMFPFYPFLASPFAHYPPNGSLPASWPQRRTQASLSPLSNNDSAHKITSR